MRLLGVIIEGQLYLAAILAIFLGVLAFLWWGLWSRRPIIGLVAVFVAIPLIRSTVSTIRACFSGTTGPEGLPLGRDEGRALYTLVEAIRRAIGGPPVDTIVITGGCCAGAFAHVPPWRFRRRRTLLLGFPVLATLSTDELRAVIAHELAHFSSAHDAFAAWVYRTRRSWFQLRASLDQRLATPLYVYWLIRWYVPRLDAASAEVSRRHELVADEVAAKVAGGRAAADALVVFESAARFADDAYWPGIRMSHETSPEPPRPYTAMLTWNARTISSGALDALFARDTARSTDTHPTLRERFAHLDQAVRLPPPIAHSAGRSILGAELEALAGRLDDEWMSRHGETWREYRAEYLEQRRTLDRLTALEAPADDDVFRRAQLVESLDGPEEALPIYLSVAERGHAASRLAAGRLLLDQMDAKGIALVEDAMDRDDSLVPEGCRMLAAYYDETHQELAARKSEWRATRHTTRARLARPLS